MALAARKSAKDKKPKRGLVTGLRVILMTALILYLSFLVYRKFGISDWLTDIGLVIGVILLMILAAFGVVALFMFIKGKTGKT